MLLLFFKYLKKIYTLFVEHILYVHTYTHNLCKNFLYTYILCIISWFVAKYAGASGWVGTFHNVCVWVCKIDPEVGWFFLCFIKLLIIIFNASCWVVEHKNIKNLFQKLLYYLVDFYSQIHQNKIICINYHFQFNYRVKGNSK